MSRCPVCKQATAKDWRPFCSKRCADIDLGRWFSGTYSVPGEPADDDDMAPGNEPDRH